MKIGICGSMAFAEQMVAVKGQLEELGHIVTVATDVDKHIEDPDFVENLDDNAAHVLANDVQRHCFEHLVAQNDAILVLNYPRKGIDGYIGVSTLMEIGLAFYLRKKIFFLFPIPSHHEHRWAHELTTMQPIILNGDLTQIG